MFKDKMVLDVSELRMKWAIDDVCGAVEALTTRLESIKDKETLDATAQLLKAVNAYIRVVGETINGNL